MMIKKKKGVIIGVQDLGSVWRIQVAQDFKKGKPVGKITEITGDWRPMRDGLDSAFDISSDEFPYTSNKKIYENVIGQVIEYVPDNIFGASSWRPLYGKKINLKVDEKTGKIKGLEKLKKVT